MKFVSSERARKLKDVMSGQSVSKGKTSLRVIPSSTERNRIHPMKKQESPAPEAASGGYHDGSVSGGSAEAAGEPRRMVYFVLEQASLHTHETKRNGAVLLSADEHMHLIDSIAQKAGKGAIPGEYRPDILHDCLKTLLDSPLSRAGQMRVFFTTSGGSLVEVNPSLRIPRSYKRFAGLMVELLKRLKIRAADSSDVLLKMVPGPVSSHLPPGVKVISLSSEGRSVKVEELANEIVVKRKVDEPVCFVIGAAAHGHPTMGLEYVNEAVSISKFNLSAACCCAKITTSIEALLGL